MATFPILTAYKDGALAELIQDKARSFLSQWPNWNEPAAMALAGAYYARLGQGENAALTMDARRASEETDNLFWWLKEEAPDSLMGYIITVSGSRAILLDMEQYDQIVARLGAMDWSERAREERLIAPARAAAEAYHEDVLERIAGLGEAPHGPCVV